MTKKQLSYNQSITLVLNHMKATKGRWKGLDRENIIRRNVFVKTENDGFGVYYSPQFIELDCCPITSLADIDAGGDPSPARKVGRQFGLDKKAVEDIIAAADFFDGLTKEQKNLRQKMSKAAK